MKAAVFHGKGDLRIEQVPIPQIKPGHVKVRVEFCGKLFSQHTFFSTEILNS